MRIQIVNGMNGGAGVLHLDAETYNLSAMCFKDSVSNERIKKVLSDKGKAVAESCCCPTCENVQGTALDRLFTVLWDECPECAYDVSPNAAYIKVGIVERLLENEPRDVVAWFAKEMEKKLTANDSKGGWMHMSITDLFARLQEEVKELAEATGQAECISEAVDVANFAMMIACVAKEVSNADGR